MASDFLTRNRWKPTISNAVAVLAALFLARSAYNTWTQVLAAEPDSSLKRRHRNVLATGLVIVLLFFFISAILGNVIGQNGEEAARLNADLEHMGTVGDRISKARNAAEATIPSHLRMYKTIEPDVRDFESTLTRLETELMAYDVKFPQQHQQTQKTSAAVDIGLRHARLLERQIIVARQIEVLDPNQQWAVWKESMQPLLDSEDQLDKAK